MSETYDYKACKIVAVLSNALQTGVALNVLGHLCVALGHHVEADIMGRPFLEDCTQIRHRGISKFPVIVTQVKTSTVRKALTMARQNSNLYVGDYPRQMLDTGHDDELAAALATAREPDLEYLGIVIFGPSNEVDAITGKYSLWR